jgi:hypothetical protein
MMTSASCTPAPEPVSVPERDVTPDRYVDMLACLADLVAATTSQRRQIEQRAGAGDPRVTEAIEQLRALEVTLCEVGADAASAHQLLQRLHLI